MKQKRLTFLASVLGLSASLLLCLGSCSKQDKKDSETPEKDSIVATVVETKPNDSEEIEVVAIDPDKKIGLWELYYSQHDDQILHEMTASDKRINITADPYSNKLKFYIWSNMPASPQKLKFNLGSLDFTMDYDGGEISLPSEYIEQAIKILDKGNCTLTINDFTIDLKDEFKGASEAWEIMKEKQK